MRTRFLTLRTSLLLLVAAVALIALAGCGPRAGSAGDAAAAGSSDLVIDLPAIYIDFAADGTSSVGGMRVSQAAALIGRDIPDLTLEPDELETLQEFNIQHLQLINTDAGLDILINGFKIPSLGWDQEVLTNLTDLLTDTGIDLGPVNGLLPLLGNINTGIVIRFPVAEGREPMPLLDPEAEQVAALARQQVAANASAGDAAVINLTVDYAPDGTWTILGLDTQGVQGALEVFGIGVEDFNLSPTRLQLLRLAGMRTVTISTDEEGIRFAVNGERLPVVTWGEGELTNVLRLIEESGMLDQLSDDETRTEGALDLMEQILPTVVGAQFSMEINFPTS